MGTEAERLQGERGQVNREENLARLVADHQKRLTDPEGWVAQKKEERLNQSLDDLVNILAAVFEPDYGPDGEQLWQVDELQMMVTTPGGQENLMYLRMTPGVNGLHITKRENAAGEPYVFEVPW